MYNFCSNVTWDAKRLCIHTLHLWGFRNVNSYLKDSRLDGILFKWANMSPNNVWRHFWVVTHASPASFRYLKHTRVWIWSYCMPYRPLHICIPERSALIEEWNSLAKKSWNDFVQIKIEPHKKVEMQWHACEIRRGKLMRRGILHFGVHSHEECQQALRWACHKLPQTKIERQHHTTKLCIYTTRKRVWTNKGTWMRGQAWAHDLWSMTWQEPLQQQCPARPSLKKTVPPTVLLPLKGRLTLHHTNHSQNSHHVCLDLRMFLHDIVCFLNAVRTRSDGSRVLDVVLVTRWISMFAFVLSNIMPVGKWQNKAHIYMWWIYWLVEHLYRSCKTWPSLRLSSIVIDIVTKLSNFWSWLAWMSGTWEDGVWIRTLWHGCCFSEGITLLAK